MGFGDFAEGAILGGADGGVLFGFEEELFPAQLVKVFEAVFFELMGSNGFADGTAGFGLVAAIAEFAGAREGFDVGESGFEAYGGVPELEFAHAGCVDEDAAARNDEELARGGSVAAAIVGSADGGGGL